MPASQREIELIHETIEHWSRMAMGCDGEKPTGEYCPLCSVYYYPMYFDCGVCPIKERTGHYNCRHSGWSNAQLAINLIQKGKRHFVDYDSIETFIDFIISLLPVEEQKRYQ